MIIKYLKTRNYFLLPHCQLHLKRTSVEYREEGLEGEIYEKKVLEESMRKGHVDGTDLQQLLTGQDGSCN